MGFNTDFGRPRNWFRPRKLEVRSSCRCPFYSPSPRGVLFLNLMGSNFFSYLSLNCCLGIVCWLFHDMPLGLTFLKPLKWYIAQGSLLSEPNGVILKGCSNQLLVVVQFWTRWGCGWKNSKSHARLDIFFSYQNP